MASKDFYQVLGVPESADADQIKKAYRKLAKKHHPDANPDDPRSAERFKEISEAYGVLSDKEQRSKYDRMRRLGAFDSMRTARSTAGGRPQSGQEEHFDFGDIGSFGLGDIFSSIFGKRRAEEPVNARPESSELSLSIPFRTAAVGGKVPVVLAMTDVCDACGGKGGAPGAKYSACPECNGRGTISFGQGGFAVNRPCPACRGRGTVPSELCPRCNGSGERRTRKELLITVPPATDSGTRVRLKGQGSHTRPGGPAGDVLITFQVEPDRFFSREGLDIHCTVPITLTQAVLGTTVKVKTVSGSKVKLKIPAGTQPGSRLKVRGQGLTKGGQTGDQIVKIDVRIPKKLTPDEERAFREFSDKVRS